MGQPVWTIMWVGVPDGASFGLHPTHIVCLDAHTSHPPIHTPHPPTHTPHSPTHISYPPTHTSHPPIHTPHPPTHPRPFLPKPVVLGITQVVQSIPKVLQFLLKCFSLPLSPCLQLGHGAVNPDTDGLSIGNLILKQTQDQRQLKHPWVFRQGLQRTGPTGSKGLYQLLQLRAKLTTVAPRDDSEDIRLPQELNHLLIVC